MASCGYSQTVLYLLLVFRQGCSAAPRGAEEGRRGQDQKNILWRWKYLLSQLTFRTFGGCFLFLTVKNSMSGTSLLFEVFIGRAGSWAAVCLCLNLFLPSFTVCTLLDWELSDLSKRPVFVPHLCYHRPMSCNWQNWWNSNFVNVTGFSFCCVTDCNSLRSSGHKRRVVSIHL